MHAPFTVDGRRSTLNCLTASVAVVGMVRASNLGEAVVMAFHSPGLGLLTFVSHTPSRRKPQ